MSQVRLLKVFAIAFLGLMCVWVYGCSDTNSEAIFDSESGEHIGNWIVEHGGHYLDDPTQCYSCHGSDLLGGPSKVSCYAVSFNGQSCHPGGPGGHPEGWADPDSHGAAAKDAPDGMTGFNVCQVCHGSYLSEGNFCYTCHTWEEAPHSPAPWFSLSGGRTHTTTDQGNAAICALCHAGVSQTPAPPGTEPGCFNNTLCHGMLHPTGWEEPSAHGAAAKDDPNGMTGFSSCQQCHGVDFSGALALSCYDCHTWDAPHGQYPWTTPTSTYTHTTTKESNAPVCGLCHEAGSNSTRQPILSPEQGAPFGCFNNTLCHGREYSHDASWTTDHSLTARVNITVCQSCHGTDYRGGTSGVSCYRCHLGGPVLSDFIMHPNNWAVPRDQHPLYLSNLGNNATSCSPTAPSGANIAQYCHGVNLPLNPALVIPPNQSWIPDVSCYDCHGKLWSSP